MLVAGVTLCRKSKQWEVQICTVLEKENVCRLLRECTPDTNHCCFCGFCQTFALMYYLFMIFFFMFTGCMMGQWSASFPHSENELVQIPPGNFLCWVLLVPVCSFFLFFNGTQVSFHSQKTCYLGSLMILKSFLVLMRVYWCAAQRQMVTATLWPQKGLSRFERWMDFVCLCRRKIIHLCAWKLPWLQSKPIKQCRHVSIWTPGCVGKTD